MVGKKFLLSMVAGSVMAATGASAVPVTTSLNAQYFIVSSGDHDFHLQSGFNYTYCTSTPGNSTGNGGCQVKPTIALGTGLDGNNRPLLSGGTIQYNNPLAGEGIADIIPGSGGGSILSWWTVGGHVSANGTGSYTLGSGVVNMYPNGVDDTHGWETAIFSGSILSTGTFDITFNMSSDDDTYIYLNGLLVAENPGVHDSSTVSTTVNGVVCGGGGCDLKVFYADRNTTLAKFGLSIDATNVTPAPEPATLALFGAGLIGMGRLRKRKSS